MGKPLAGMKCSSMADVESVADRGPSRLCMALHKSVGDACQSVTRGIQDAIIDVRADR